MPAIPRPGPLAHALVHPAEHRIDDPRCPGADAVLGPLDSLIQGRVGRDPVHQDELGCPEDEHRTQRGLELTKGPLEPLADQKVEREPSADRGVVERVRQGSIAVIQSPGVQFDRLQSGEPLGLLGQHIKHHTPRCRLGSVMVSDAAAGRILSAGVGHGASVGASGHGDGFQQHGVCTRAGPG